MVVHRCARRGTGGAVGARARDDRHGGLHHRQPGLGDAATERRAARRGVPGRSAQATAGTQRDAALYRQGAPRPRLRAALQLARPCRGLSSGDCSRSRVGQGVSYPTIRTRTSSSGLALNPRISSTSLPAARTSTVSSLASSLPPTVALPSTTIDTAAVPPSLRTVTGTTHAPPG